jgi:hypothetical protein
MQFPDRPQLRNYEALHLGCWFAFGIESSELELVQRKTDHQMFAPLFIYILVPIIGVLAFWLLIRKMRGKGVVSPPEIPFFILFFTFGGWLQVLLTAWLWEWSGLASIGTLYLILIAPVITAVMSWRLRTTVTLSAYHRLAFLASGAYTCIISIGMPVAIYTHLIGR